MLLLHHCFLQTRFCFQEMKQKRVSRKLVSVSKRAAATAADTTAAAAPPPSYVALSRCCHRRAAAELPPTS